MTNQKEKKKKVSSVNEYISAVYTWLKVGKKKNDKPACVLFRGQPDKNWDDVKRQFIKCQLMPRIARKKPAISLDEEKKMIEEEKKMIDELELRAPPLLVDDEFPAKTWEWIALAQHHGLATRLLDWTRYGLAALWFAVCEQRGGWETRLADAAVWMFRYEDEDIKKAKKDNEVYETFDDNEKKRTQVLLTRHIDRRMVAQAACFTAHSPDSRGHFTALDDEKLFKDSLKKIEIPGEYCSPLRKELDLLGINESVLFPDLDGLCSHIAYSQRVKRQSGQGS